MQIVIDISGELYNKIDHIQNGSIAAKTILNCVKDGTILPKGHGRLIDADSCLRKSWHNFYRHEDEMEKKDEDYLPIQRLHEQKCFEVCQQTLVNAQTVIEADKGDD